MLITDEFVMINFPKTGSSFARAVLKQIHRYDTLPNRIRRRVGLPNKPPLQELILPVIDRRYPPGLRGQHGTYRQIPLEHRHKTIVSIIRNPFDRYVSLYLFGWWKRVLPAERSELEKAYPRFPDLTFVEYYDLANHVLRPNRLGGIQPKIELGLHTIQFIQFYFKEPERVLSEIDDDYIEQERYVQDMADVIFLRQRKLNQDLYQFLLNKGYPEADIRFIREAERVNTTSGRSDRANWKGFYTPALIAEVLKKDRLIFKLFDYPTPQLQESPPGTQTGAVV
jgi:hypothetical protein